MTLPETVAVCSLTIAMVANIVFVSRAWGRLSSIIEHLTKSVDSLSSSIHGLDAQSHSHANRITRLETIHEANGTRQHLGGVGPSYKMESPRFREHP
jgi:uncharacterized protein YoxC